ncbi:lipopolysaccharide biosynthesis protein [Vibrio diabolicus]|uniref:lipopolysaccharide biosynthesis protein n=1 Tax=Vibrio diabolicus TaxID=50719 RepID=UPI00211A3B7E|nr:hypothetical protein [Vibrio diabolicus]MCQ9051053.1 hypothetical protein [Vibrio diabolicus]
MIKKVLQLSSGNLASSIISFFSIPFIMGLYGVEKFGVFGLFSSMLTVYSVLAFLRYEQVISIAKNHKELNCSIFTSLYNLIFTTSICCVLALINPLFFNINSWLIVIAGITTSLSFLVEQINIYKESYKSITYSKLLRALSFLIFSYSLYYKGLNDGLLYSTIITNILVTVFLVFPIKDINLKLITPSQYYTTLIEYKDFPKYSLPQGLLFAFSFSLPLMLIQRRFSEYELGLFSFAQKVLEAPVRLISGPLINVLKREFTTRAVQDRVNISKRYVYKVSKVCLLIFSSSLMIYIITVNYNLLGDFEDSLFIVVLLLPFVLIRIVNSPFISLLTVDRKMNFVLINEFLVMLSTLLSFMLFSDFIYSVFAYSLSRVIVGCVFCMLNYRRISFSYGA